MRDELIEIEIDPDEDHQVVCAINIATIHQGLQLLNYYLPHKNPDFKLFDPFLGSIKYYLDQLLGKHERKPVSLTSLDIGQSHRTSSVAEFNENDTFRGSGKFRAKFRITDETGDDQLPSLIESVYESARNYLENPDQEYPKTQFEILEEVFADLRGSYPL